MGHGTAYGNELANSTEIRISVGGMEPESPEKKVGQKETQK